MNKELTCIVCPNGCDLHIAYEKSAETIEVLSVEGALCKRGETYARQELIAPKRSIASSVLVEGGELPLVSVRTKGVIPKNMIFPVMKRNPEDGGEGSCRRRKCAYSRCTGAWH